MKKWEHESKSEAQNTMYTTLCLMKMLCKKGQLPKVQYNTMIKTCSQFFDTSDFYLFEVSFILYKNLVWTYKECEL